MLPRASITSIKTKLSNAVSAKDPHAIAAAVDLPPLPKAVGANASSSNGGSGPQHGEYLKVDGVDWSNVLNPLLDAHAAVQSVRVVLTIRRKSRGGWGFC